MEDVKGLPNVKGLENFVADPATTDKATSAPTQVQTPTDPSKIDIGQFKTQEDLLKAYKEIQGFSTRVAQENKELKENLAQFNEQMELMRLQRPVQNTQPAQQMQGQDFDSQFIANPRNAIAGVASQAAVTARIAEALEEEHLKNPSEYQERFAYATQLSNQYPQLTQSAPGIRKLFDMADKFRKEDYQKKGMAFVKAVIGEDADFEKFKLLLRKGEADKLTQTSNAYMPDTSGSTRTLSETEILKKGRDAEIAAGVAKGDVDTVIANVFRKALET